MWGSHISVLPGLEKINLPSGAQRKNDPPIWNRSLGHLVIGNLAPYATLKVYVFEVLVLNIVSTAYLFKTTFEVHF